LEVTSCERWRRRCDGGGAGDGVIVVVVGGGVQKYSVAGSDRNLKSEFVFDDDDVNSKLKIF